MVVGDVPAGINAETLGKWIADNFGVTDVEYRTLSVGRSNLTYAVLAGGERRWVLRRPPLGYEGGSAHNVMREGRIMQALGPTDVPTVNVRALVDDPAVLEVPFVFMDFCQGHSMYSPDDLARVPQGNRRDAGFAMVDVLAKIHAVDIDAIGLGDLRRPGSLAERQLRRWLSQFKNITMRDIPDVERVHDLLVAKAPQESVTGLVHGDYKPNNMIWSDAGEIRAVVDWELALTGEVEADLGYLMAMVYGPQEYTGIWTPTEADGFPSKAEMISRYEAASGITAHNVGYFEAFALWKLACIMEGVYTRLVKGQMGDLEVDVEKAGEGVRDLVLQAEAALG